MEPINPQLVIVIFMSSERRLIDCPHDDDDDARWTLSRERCFKDVIFFLNIVSFITVNIDPTNHNRLTASRLANFQPSSHLVIKLHRLATKGIVKTCL